MIISTGSTNSDQTGHKEEERDAKAVFNLKSQIELESIIVI